MDNSGKDVYSSEDEIRRPVVKRKKKAKNTISSDTEEEEDSDIDIKPRRLTKPRRCESDDENNNDCPTCSGSRNCTESLNDLSDNDQADKCAICLSKFLGQDIATPETCDHVFCLECIQEWAKNVNTCPIDRLKFNLILIRHHKEEKIIKTIFVNNSALPYTSDSETESQGQADCCDLCGEDKNEGALLRCHECHKFYHYHCILPALHPTPSDTWQCPACENFIWGAFARMTPSAFRVYQSLNSGIRTPSPTRSTLHSSQEFLRLRRRVLYPRSVIQRLLSSESSEEDVRNSVPSSVYRNPLISSVTSKARCPLLRKRRNLCRARNRALVSATSAATESTYTSDSDDGYGFAASTPETFDVVGSILESQTRLHRPDILTLTRDGTLLQTPKTGSPRPSNIASSTSDFEESAQSSFSSSSPSDNTTKLPLSNNTVVKQTPLHPSNSNSSKYGEASMQAYSCSSSGTPRERTLSYDENPLARPAHGANSNDHFGNEPCSPVVQKGFCLSASTDDMKKDGRTTKGQHSEDEVDIYSDIESVGEEDGVTNDSVEPAKVAFKCDDSQLSNPNDSSDLSDNDLVIDEGQQADEDHEKFKDSQESNKEKINQICDSEESNMSSNAASDQEQLTIDTAPQNPSSSLIENSSDNCFNPGDESPHGVFVNDESNHSKLNSEHQNTGKYESDSDAGPQVSDVDMQEDGENSVDSAKKSYQGDASTPCTSVKSSPKSCRGETADGFEMQGENSISNENSQSNIDNVSLGEQEESKEVFEEVSNQENEDTCNSGSRGGEAENFENENNNSNLSEPTSPIEKIDNQNSFDFVNDQQNASEPDEPMEVSTSQEEYNNNSELINICNDISMKSDEEDNLDSIENASTPCMDENLDGQIENSPMHVENSEEEANDLEKTSQPDSEEEKEDSENENVENKSEPGKSVESSPKLASNEDLHDGSVDLGIEDISDAGSEEISNVLGEDHLPSTNVTEEEFDDVERKVASLFSPIPPDEDDCIIISKQDSAEFNKCSPPQTNQSFEDQEEGEIIEERPVHRCKKKKNRTRDSTGEYGEYAPRVNISDLPRIPKLKRDRDKDSIPETLSFDNKRTSVLSRVDLGGDISWKRLSKHTRERSYRDGRPKDERLLFRERESRKKSKKSNDASRRNDSKNSERRRDDKKVESEKSKGDYDSRSRKSEKNKSVNYSSDREKRKTHKDRHSSKDRHSKDNKKEKDKYDKKYSKDDDKYEREKLKDEIRFERDLRYDKGERFERIVYEKGKFKEKEHKSKHKDRKSETSKTCKEHSREKHKHSHSGDHFSDKQREVRKIDDKIKIVVEQKESRKDKSKHKDKKEIKNERKPIIPRKAEPPERSPYKEITSIESKEIFAKGDSIIINVNFNRAVSPKVTAAPESDSNVKERKVLSEDQEVDEKLTSADVKSKSKLSVDKTKTSLDNSVGKRPTTPTGKNTSVLSVSESYWQGGEDPDGNNSPASEKSVEIISDEVEAAGSGETNSCSSPEALTIQTDAKNSTLLPEKTSLTPINEATDSILKESDSFSSKRRSPRSPSPPSPADNDSYDPCEPTRSPSPPPMPPSPPLPTANPKPPPSPELPPLPPEPEPTEDKPNTPDFVSSTPASNASQANTVQTQTLTASPMQSLLLPPSFLSRVSAATNTLQGMSPLAPSRNGNFQMNNIMLPPNQMQQMMGANFMPHMGGSTLQPPPNPPNMSLPPPPPPPTGMTLLSQTRHPRMNVQPPLTPSSLLQSLTMVHNVNTAPMQLIHHLPPNLSGILANHPSTIVQNPPPSSLPVSTANQQVMRMIFSQQSQMPNHGAFLPSQTANNCNKSQSNLVSSGSLQQKSDKQSKRSPSAEKNEVIDMDVGTPYSPGDSPSVDSVGDYSPGACSPEASSPKNKDVFDSLFSANQRTSEKRTHDSISTNEKPKAHSTSKKSKHEHKKHAVRMQVKEKHKKSRKEQKQVDEAELKILDELPSSAVEMQVKEKYMVKLNRQERVVDEVKNLLKPLYKTRDVTKEEYKDILRKAVPKICHNRSGDINLRKIRSLVESYVKKAKHSRKKGDKRKSKFS